jgi:trans-aconitate methyltransferase
MSMAYNELSPAQLTFLSSQTEQQRLKDQHEAWKALMHGSVVHAPVKDPKLVIDIGCGPGSVSRELASKFPAAQVYGIDLSSMPEEHANRPANLEYIQGDVMKLLSGAGDARLNKGNVDYSFHRLLLCGMAKWPEYVKTVASSVCSGGWVEMHEWNWQIMEDGKNVSEEWPWQEEMIQAARDTKGLDLLCAHKVAGWMHDAGLVDIKTVCYSAPIGAWDLAAHPESKVMADYLPKWWQTVNWGLIPLFVGATNPQVVEEYKAQMLEDLEKARVKQRKAYEIVVTYARKP